MKAKQMSDNRRNQIKSPHLKKTFKIKINKENFSSFGSSKRQAEIAVAKQALKYLKEQNG